jgi:hypothetical protein
MKYKSNNTMVPHIEHIILSFFSWSLTGNGIFFRSKISSHQINFQSSSNSGKETIEQEDREE